MEEKDFKRIMIVFVLIVLAFLSILVIKPLFTPIVIGLLLAYIFNPLYKRLNKRIKSQNFCAFLLCILILVLILLPIVSLFPLIAKQTFEVYTLIRESDLTSIVRSLMPSLFASPVIATELTAAISNINAGISNVVLKIFQDTIMNLPSILFGIIIFLFTFFFAVKEGENFKKYLFVIFPFPKEYQNLFSEKFDQVTNSVIYGQIVVGIAQGLVSGIGYFVLGVPNALLLTVITTVIGVIPIIGPWLVWIPLDIVLFVNGDTTRAIQLLIYGLFVINMVDTLLRPQIVSSKTQMNSAIVLIGMIGGVYAFGIVGFVIGPLLLASLILLVELYKDKKSEESIILKEPEKQPIP